MIRDNLSALFLLVGLSCFLSLLPFPPLFFASSLPGAIAFSSVSGSACLLIGLLCRLLLWQQRRRKARQSTRTIPASAKEPPYHTMPPGPDAIQTVLGVHSEAELELVPGFVLRAVSTHYTEGRESLARHLLEEWRSQPEAPAEATQEDNVRSLHCGVCTLPERDTLLVPCTRCQTLAHESCCAFVRRGQVAETILSIDPVRRPHCWICLGLLQQEGCTLVYDESGLLLVRQANPHSHE